MPGTRIDITLLRNADLTFGGVESIVTSQFNSPLDFSSNSTVEKLDISGTNADRFLVSMNYAETDTPPTFIPVAGNLSPQPPGIATVVASAIDFVNAVYPGSFV